MVACLLEARQACKSLSLFPFWVTVLVTDLSEMIVESVFKFRYVQAVKPDKTCSETCLVKHFSVMHCEPSHVTSLQERGWCQAETS